MSSTQTEFTFVHQGLSNSLRESPTEGGCAFTCTASHSKTINTHVRISKPNGSYPNITRGLDYILAPCRKSSECGTMFVSRNPIRDIQYRDALVENILHRLANEAFSAGKETAIAAEDIPSILREMESDGTGRICWATLSDTFIHPDMMSRTPIFSVEPVRRDADGPRTFIARSFDFHVGSLDDATALNTELSELIETKVAKRRSFLAGSAPEVVQHEEDRMSESGEIQHDLMASTGGLEQSFSLTTIEPDTDMLHQMGMFRPDPVSRTDTEESRTSGISLSSIRSRSRQLAKKALRGVKVFLTLGGTVRRTSVPQGGDAPEDWIDATRSGTFQQDEESIPVGGQSHFIQDTGTEEPLAREPAGLFELSGGTIKASATAHRTVPESSLNRAGSTGGQSWQIDDDRAVIDREALPAPSRRIKRAEGTENTGTGPSTAIEDSESLKTD